MSEEQPVADADESGAIGRALDRICAGLTAEQAAELRDRVRAGLALLDSTAPDDVLADELISPAAELPPGARLDWARAFAMEHELRPLNSRALGLAQELLAAGREAPGLGAEAERLLATLESIDPGVLEEESRRRLYRLRNEAIADARWVMSGGEGPASLRVGRLMQKR